MSEDIKPEVIKMTQESLGKFVKKPPLTDKLLKKPPFRFLHDIVTNIIRDTGFLSGLYSDIEMQSDNIKDRDAKIAFLQKLIDCLKIVTEKTIAARPSKIVAGLEPGKTNELLQTLGYALNKNLSSETAVSQLQTGQTAPKTKTKPKDERKVIQKSSKEKTDIKQSSSTTSKTKKSSDKFSKKSDDKPVLLSNRSKDSPKTKTNKTRDEPKKEKTPTTKTDKKVSKTKATKSDKSPKQSSLANKIIPETPPKVIEVPIPKIETPPPPEVILETPELIKSELTAPTPEKSEILEFQTNTPKDIEPIPEKAVEELSEKTPTPKKLSAKVEKPPVDKPEMMRSKDPPKIERPKTSLRPPSVRPSSARPGAPRLKDRNEIILLPDEVVHMGKVNVIVENFSNRDDEEDNEETVIVETVPELTFEEPPVPIVSDMPAEKGHLVAQILEQLGDSAPESIESKQQQRVEIEWGEAGGKRNREAASREMDRLKNSIQTLTRAANPLGKLMNFLQEDVDSMRSELKMWIDVNDKLTDEIKVEERSNDESIFPLIKQLQRLEDDIAKQHELISLTQANILRNEHKIKSLLTRDS